MLPGEGGSLRVHDLEPDEHLAYRLSVTAGDVLEVVVQQDEVDVQLELYVEGDEAPLLQVNDYPWIWKEAESLFHVAKTSQELRLVVRSTSTRRGAPRLEVERLGPATPNELERAEAERLFASSRIERNERGSDAVSEDKVDALRRAAASFGKLSLPRRQAMAENEAASLLHQLGRPAEAVAAADRGIALAKAAADDWAECDLRATRAEAVFVQSVDASIDELLAITEEFSVSGAAPCLLAVSRILVYDLSQQYQFDRAIEIFERALPLSHELDEPWERAGLLMNVGTAYLGKQDFSSAIDIFTRAKDAYEQLGDERMAILNLDNRTIARREVGELEELLDDHRTVLDFLERQSELGDLALAEIGFSRTLAELERRREAAEVLERAAGRSEAPPGVRALAWRLLAGLLIDLGELDRARALLERAMTTHAELGYSLRQLVDDLMLGKWQEAAGERQSALATYRALAERAVELGLDEIELEARLALAELLEDMALANEGELERAVEISEGVRGTLLSDRFRSSFSRHLRHLYDLQLRSGLRRLRELDSTSPEEDGEQLIESLFELTEQAKARSLRDFLSMSRGDLVETMDPALARRERELLADAQRLSRERRSLLQKRSSATDSSVDARLESLGGELEDKELQLEILAGERLRRDPRRASLLDARPLDVQSLRRVLGERTLVSYYVLEDRTLAFVVRSASVALHDLGEDAAQEDLEEDISGVLEAMRRPTRSVGQLAVRAHALWRLLMEPIGEIASGSLVPSKIVISPDGPLHSLPFEALVAVKAESGARWRDLDFLVDDHEISYVPSAGILSLIGERRQTAFATDLVALAGVGRGPAASARSRASLRRLGELPNAAREVQAVARALAPPASASSGEGRPGGQATTRVLTGEEASETAARSALATNARYLHFATHGVVDPDRDSESFLVLGADDQHDGLLQLREIVRLDIAADLVALSACSTAVGTRKTGEGVLSLARGFLFAGAASLLASLWEVSDSATADLMVELYRRLATGQTKAEALRGAKQLLRNSERHAHPYYWAPFVLTGAPDSGGGAQGR